MEDIRSLGELLLLTCGWPCLIALLLLSALTWGGGIYLIQTRRRMIIIDYLPLTWLPLLVGGFRSLLGMITALSLLRGTGGDEGALLVGMAFVPMLLGFSLSIPGFVTVAAGRAALTWHAAKPVAEPHSKDVERLIQAKAQREAEETEKYLATFSRPRS